VELGFSSTVVCGAPVKDHNLNNREEKKEAKRTALYRNKNAHAMSANDSLMRHNGNAMELFAARISVYPSGTLPPMHKMPCVSLHFSA
jgi:hypothetical protein